jgi:hypothetical protein
MDVTWIPVPLGQGDISLMEIATFVYNSKGSVMINYCRTYLNIISIYDLLLLDQVEIHPDYMKGIRPPSRVSYIIWPPSRAYGPNSCLIILHRNYLLIQGIGF